MSALGSEFKINIHVEPIDGSTMDKYDFECFLYVYQNKGVTFKKGDTSVKISEGGTDCIICVSTPDAMKIGRGSVKLKFTAHVDDTDFPDKKRTEIVDGICTGVTIT